MTDSTKSPYTLLEAAQHHIDSLDAYECDLVPINRTRGTADALRQAIAATQAAPASPEPAPGSTTSRAAGEDEHNQGLMSAKVAFEQHSTTSVEPITWECNPSAWSKAYDDVITYTFPKDSTKLLITGLTPKPIVIHAPEPASPNTGAVGWLIEWTAPDGASDYVFFKHNGIGDYRALYPSATVRELVERPPATPSPSKGGEADSAAEDNTGKET